MRQILQVAKHSCNVLIVGPTGTGKELIARAIHESSPRQHQPYIPVDCAAIVPSRKQQPKQQTGAGQISRAPGSSVHLQFLSND